MTTLQKYKLQKALKAESSAVLRRFSYVNFSVLY